VFERAQAEREAGYLLTQVIVKLARDVLAFFILRID